MDFERVAHLDVPVQYALLPPVAFVQRQDDLRHSTSCGGRPRMSPVSVGADVAGVSPIARAWLWCAFAVCARNQQRIARHGSNGTVDVATPNTEFNKRCCNLQQSIAHCNRRSRRDVRKRSGTASRHVAWPWNVSERSAGKQWPEGRQKLNGGLMYAARDCNGTGAREDRSVYVCVYVWVRARARGLVRVTARARVK